MKKEFNANNKTILSVNAVSPVVFTFSDGNLAHCIVQNCSNANRANEKAKEFYSRLMADCNTVRTNTTVNEYLTVCFEGYKKNGSLYNGAKITHVKDTDKRKEYPILNDLNAFKSHLNTIPELRVVTPAKEPTNTNETEKEDNEENETQETIKQAASLSPIDLINGLLVHFHENGKATKALLKFQKDFIS